MDNPWLDPKPLEGPGSAARLGRLRARFEAASGRGGRRPGRLAAVGFAAMAVWSVGSLGVIGVGLERIYPQARVQLAAVPQAQAEAAAGRNRPYPSCAVAHADSVYDIPNGSPIYTPHQNGDGDGLACEPVR